MADDWRPGDLALCVNARPISRPRIIHGGLGLREGAGYTVSDYLVRDRDGDTVLFLREIDHSDGFGRLAARFRKINPLTDAEREEAMRDLKLPENV